MRIAFLGCGYVSNMYRTSLSAHPELTLAGAYDRQRPRAETMARMTGTKAYASFEALLEDPSVELVVNLTNPREHYATTKALLEAGKHVYSEKPLAMRFEEAEELVTLAERRGLQLSSAPCTLLNSVAQTLWKAVREEEAGRVRLVYAEMDDGMVPREPTGKWVNEMGAPWPAIDEFEVGCTVEHAGYVLTWLCAFFGPVEHVSAFSGILMEDKLPGMVLAPAPDFSVACLRFRSGVVARMTNGLYAERDHRLRLWGDVGVLEVEEPWSDHSRVTLRRYISIRRRRLLLPRRRIRLLGPRERAPRQRGAAARDYLRSVGEMAAAIRAGRQAYANARFSLHVTEVTLACHYAQHPTGASLGYGALPYQPHTSFEPLEPLPWAT